MIELYQAADDLGVQVYVSSIPEVMSMSIPGAICMDASLAYGGAVERVHFAHELGHCARCAFYTRQDPPWIRKRCEHKADKWAIKKLVPKDELKKAVAAGYTEPWQLAEYFDITTANSSNLNERMPRVGRLSYPGLSLFLAMFGFVVLFHC